MICHPSLPLYGAYYLFQCDGRSSSAHVDVLGLLLMVLIHVLYVRLLRVHRMVGVRVGDSLHLLALMELEDAVLDERCTKRKSVRV